jgi:hypothetical protein
MPALGVGLILSMYSKIILTDWKEEESDAAYSSFVAGVVLETRAVPPAFDGLTLSARW